LHVRALQDGIGILGMTHEDDVPLWGVTDVKITS
jgi:hypothetical protein